MGLYNNDTPLKQLQTLLEGKTISKIEEPNASEAIAKFVMADGSAFRLHATDLGFWIEETRGANGYNSLDTLIRDYYHHAYRLGSFAAEVYRLNSIDDVLVFRSSDNTLFSIDISKLSKKELIIVSDKRGLEILGEAVGMGDMWKTFFQKNRDFDDVPEHLRVFDY